MKKRRGKDELDWWAFQVDGKVVGVVEEGRTFEAEQKRLRGLSGISIRAASPEEMIRFRARTEVPKSITDKWREARDKQNNY